ncbi:hypothetical protein [Primorskyibacter sp. S87]|uniref:tetratricopeptide repeat protein n=1 Tax=Primorskyibacter sp. S87 TaxID=3415126 RepID=UPI003C7E6B05
MNDTSNNSEPDCSAADLSTEADILGELQRVRSSEMFKGASRLGDLLDYVVNQNLSDPSRKIFAKTIAEEVYGRSPDQDTDNHNIVRVDAGRLRRRLAEYYAGPGQNDPLFIHVDTGGYVPRYEIRRTEDVETEARHQAGDSPPPARSGRKTLVVLTLAALLVGFGLGALIHPFGRSTVEQPLQLEHSGDPKLEAERLARLAKSPSSLQAVTLSDHARNLIFPMFERQQLELSLAMFQQAIRKDAGYFGGHAGSAQCLAAMAIFLPDGPKRTELIEEARQSVDRAEELSPTNSWTQSALSWVLYVEGDIEQAKEHADIALNLAPADGNVLDFYAILMLFVGEFEASRSASDMERLRTSGLGRFANLSINGAANFHLGNYQEAIVSLNAATASGDPFSAPTLAYLAASHQALGNTKDAKRYVLELAENWPDFDPEVTLRRLYKSPDQVAEIADKLTEAGWARKP